MTNPNDSIATLRLLAKCGSMDLSMLGPIADEITQLRGNLSLAEEGLASYALEVKRLRGAMQTIVSEGDYTAPEGMKRIAQAALSGSPEPLPVASRDADHCDYPDCEHHWELVIDWALAAMKKLHESAEPDTDHPEIPAIIPAAAFRAFVDEHARLMRIRASAPQGASRDASSEKDK